MSCQPLVLESDTGQRRKLSGAADSNSPIQQPSYPLGVCLAAASGGMAHAFISP